MRTARTVRKADRLSGHDEGESIAEVEPTEFACARLRFDEIAALDGQLEATAAAWPEKSLAPQPWARLTSRVIFYGLADWSVNEVIEFYASRREAETALAQAIADEPEFDQILAVVSVDFG